MVLKAKRGSLIGGESDIITLYCQPDERLRELFVSFNTNQKPRIKSPKVGILRTKIIWAFTIIGLFPVQIQKEKKRSDYARLDLKIRGSHARVVENIGVARGGHGRAFALSSLNFALPSKPSSYLNWYID